MTTLDELLCPVIPPELISNEAVDRLGFIICFGVGGGAGAAVDAQVETVDKNTSVSDCLR